MNILDSVRDAIESYLSSPRPLPQLLEEMRKRFGVLRTRFDHTALKEATRQELSAAMRLHSSVFPTTGVVRKSGDYLYLKIDDGGNYTHRGSEVLSLTELDPGDSTPHALVRAPPSPVGSHVTLVSTSESLKRLGQRLAFTVDPEKRGVVSYGHEKGGKAPSGFDSSFFPQAWYVIYVGKLPDELRNPLDPPHISIANRGFQKM